MQITIDDHLVTCDCGFYSHSLTPIDVAIEHNWKVHNTGADMWHLKYGLLSPTDGEIILHARNQNRKD